MPIRFRCAYCNQLMGIARRKAGTVVSCPTCAGQVVVPNPDGAPEQETAPSPPPAAAGPRPDLFERSDFGHDLFAGAPQGAARAGTGRSGGFLPVPKLPPAPEPAGLDDGPASASLAGYAPPPAGAPGIFLTPGKVTVLAVFVVLLIGVAFFAGMLVGRS